MASTSSVLSDGGDVKSASGAQNACIYAFAPLDSETPSREERLKPGIHVCLECYKQFTMGVNGWRRVPLREIEKLTLVNYGSLHSYYGVLSGFLCIDCVFTKLKMGMEDGIAKDPPLCLECGHVFPKADTASHSVSIQTLEWNQNVSFYKRYGVETVTLCKSCAGHLMSTMSVKRQLAQEVTEENVVKASVNCTPSKPHLNHTGLANKIASITMTSGKKVYGSTKRAVILHEMKRFKSKCSLCRSCKCKVIEAKEVHGNKTTLETYTQDEPPRKDRVTKLYDQGMYRDCVMLLARRHKGVVKTILGMAHKIVKNEALQYRIHAKKLLVGQHLNEETVRDFSWSSIVEEARSYMPNLVEMLSIMIGPASTIKKTRKTRQKRKVGRPVNCTEADDMLVEARLGFIIAMITNGLNSSYSLVQAMLSIEAWKFGISPQFHERLANLGILLRGWKNLKSRVEGLYNIETYNLKTWAQDAVAVSEKRGTLVDPLPSGMKEGLGFCLGWREIKMEIGATRYNHGKVSKVAVLFAVRNRANFSHDLSDKPLQIQAKDIPLKDLLPSHNDYIMLRQRMDHVVRRILVKHLGLKECHAQPIQHRYSDHMKEMSEMVHLGIVKEDPSTDRGIKAILQEFSKHVPVDEQGQPVPMPVCVDSQTLKTILTMRHDANETNSQVQALVPVTQEFIKIQAYLREFYDLFYSYRSRGDKGTVYQLMEAFGTAALFKSEDDSKRGAFLQLITESHVLMLAKDLSGNEGSDFLLEGRDTQLKLNQLASAVVDFLWCEDYEEQIKEVLNAEEHGHQARNLQERIDRDEETPMEIVEDDGCPCKQNYDEGMIRCAFLHCPVHNFHLSCVGLTPSTFPGDEWWCSDECETMMSDKNYAFCFCHNFRKDIPMVQCELAGHCTENQWYHLACLRMKEENIPDTWFCCDACKAQRRPPTQDYKQNYAKELTWQGLKYMTRMDAIHEGDGEAMLSYWKLDLLHFWNKNNWSLTIAAHNFLTGVKGLYSPRLAHELIWNRVANITGLPSDNVCLDQVDELVNRDYREMVCRSDSKGILAEHLAERHNIFGGRMSNLHHLFFTQKECRLLGRKDVANNHLEVRSLVEQYEDERLFDLVAGRHHAMFPDFKVDHKLRDLQLLAGDLKKLSELLDKPQEPNTQNEFVL